MQTVNGEPKYLKLYIPNLFHFNLFLKVPKYLKS